MELCIFLDMITKKINEAEAMEELEIKYLKDFNIRNPYTYEI